MTGRSLLPPALTVLLALTGARAFAQTTPAPGGPPVKLLIAVVAIRLDPASASWVDASKRANHPV